MNKIHAAITAVNVYVPDYVLTNHELETMVETNDEWITSRTGIKERRILKGEGLATSDQPVNSQVSEGRRAADPRGGSSVAWSVSSWRRTGSAIPV